MTRRRPPAGYAQDALLDVPRRQAVHISAGGHCVACGVSLVALAAWDDCFCCPGWVEPAPSGALLDAVEPAADTSLAEAA